jgi:large subunit ribosomal protein L33
MWEESREANFLCGECRDSEHSCMQVQIHRKRFTIKKETEVAVVRVKITLACEECKQRNYNLTKDKKTHPDRMETKKYCKFCKAHTMHKETK